MTDRPAIGLVEAAPEFAPSDTPDRLERLERLEAVALLFSGAAHDVCDLLNAIRLTTVHALRGVDGAEARACFEEILSCTDHARTIMQTLRSGVGVAELVEVDAVALLSENHRLLRTLAGRRVGLDVCLRSVAPIRAAPTAVLQAVANLVVNAAEALGDAGGRVTISTAQEGSEVTVEVSDDGPGLDPERRRRATDPFFTTKAKGMGLGLAFVRRIAEQHGARLEIHSEPGSGARVCLVFDAAS